MDVITETEMLDRITAFRARHDDMAPTTFGRKATGNANLISDLEEGKSPSLRTVRRVVGFMKAFDADAATRAKLAAPIESSAPPGGEEAIELPFSKAPVNPTGASSPTSCSTTVPRPMRAANGSSRCSTSAADAEA